MGGQVLRVLGQWGRQTTALAIAAVVLGTLGVGSATACERSLGNDRAADPTPVVAFEALPTQAQQTYQRIRSGGPFPYAAKDGSVFGNRERKLPARTRGYYREYTVETPGSRTRGARRIVCGGCEPRTPEVCYYTKDHYVSFLRIAQQAQ